LQDTIPDTLYQSYQASGTAHILVISGFNITIISAIISRFFRRIFPYGWDAVASVAAIILYTLLVGAEPPVVRAAIMGILALPASLLGRRMIHLNILTFTAAMMLFFSPNLMQDVSFQLTFLATLGIVLFSEPLNQFFDRTLFRKKSPEEGSASGRWIKEYLLVTVAAQIGVLPVLLSHFDYISLVTLPANLLILPAQPLVMISAGVALLAGLVFPPLGNLVAKVAWLPLFYSDQIALWMGALPIAMMKISHSWAWLGWAALLGLMIPAVRYHFHSFEKTPD
jgi:competence protein ComEC